MQKGHEQRRVKKAEISIFQTTKPRLISTKIQLFLIMVSLISSFFVVVIMAEGEEIEFDGFRLKCPSSRISR